MERTRHEIGGYIELDTYTGSEFHTEALALNCGRSCLAYLIEARGIKSLLLPSFLCSSVIDTAKRYPNVEVREYPVTHALLPDYDAFEIGDTSYLYLVDYYGQLAESDIACAAERCRGRVIIDEAQSFFKKPLPNTDTLYTCRKFFGVADGAYLYTTARLEQTLPQDESFKRMGFLLGRYERNASEFYAAYSANNELFATEPIKRMSKLTQNLLRGIAYTQAQKAREENFAYLHERFRRVNELNLQLPTGPFMYPLLVENGEVARRALQQEKIYIPTLWPYALQKDTAARDLAQRILPLPIDQRYSLSDMAYLAERVEALI